MLTGLAVGVAGYLLHRRLARWLVGSAAEFEHRTKVAADQASTLHERLPRIFFKPIGDEAALAMTWTSGMASLMAAAAPLLLQSVRLLAFDSALRSHHWQRGVDSYMVRRNGGVSGITILADGTTTAAKLATAIRESVPPGFSRGDFDIAYLVLDLPVVFALALWSGPILGLAALVAVTLVAWLAAAGAGIPTLRAALFMRILVEAAPLGNHELVLVDVSAAQRQERVAAAALGHSSSESPSVITAVLRVIHALQSPQLEKQT